jgi:hypothetical protein
VTARGRYLVGVGVIAGCAVILSFLVPPGGRRGLWAALGLGLLVQGPLGWWLVRVIGTERFLRVWAVGLAARVGLVAVSAVVLIPALGVPRGTTLFSLVGVLLALLGVEAVAVLPGRSGPEVR